MKIVVTSLWYPNYDKLAEFTVMDNLALYCFRLGYPFVPYRIDEPIDPDPYKMACRACKKNTELILKTFEDFPDCDYVFHRDCDSIITNMSHKLEVLADFYKDYDIITGQDKAGISMGQVLVKNTERAKAYLREILAGIESNQYEHEQKFMWDNPRDFLIMAPRRWLNSYDCESRLEPLDDPQNWQPGDFLVHLAGLNLEQKMNVVQKWMAEVNFNGK